MNSGRNKIIFRALALIVLGSMIILSVAYFQGLHIHRLPDGRVIIHSHAIPESDGNKSNSHNHSDREYAGYGIQASILSKLLIEPVISVTIASILLGVIVAIQYKIRFTRIIQDFDQRAPPFLPTAFAFNG